VINADFEQSLPQGWAVKNTLPENPSAIPITAAITRINTDKRPGNTGTWSLQTTGRDHFQDGPKQIITIALNSGVTAKIVNNDVSGISVTASQDARAIQVSATNTFIERNRVSNTSVITNTFGIMLFGSGANIIEDNRVSNFSSGITLSGGVVGKYRDNIVSSCTTAYSGGTDAGNND